MLTQDHFWSLAATDYERLFVDPYRADVRGNPLLRLLRRLADPVRGVVADLGCGIGPILPFLSRHFRTVHAVDFAEEMLNRARERGKNCMNVTFHAASFLDLRCLPEPIDVAVAVNSLVLPNPDEIEKALREIGRIIKPGGYFLGIVPAMDAVHYATALLVDRALDAGMPIDAARKNAAHHNDHPCYDFAFGDFRFQGLHQHFWQPFEIPYRFGRAGLTVTKLKKVRLSWRQFAGAEELHAHAPPWDWFFLARRPEN
ncbi:MAG: class I SAM-dependent methyltransferase [Planctomycetes bacterium]|nr:class I SAM-dependent methyltransferase [Planctomycetota bacterium]